MLFRSGYLDNTLVLFTSDHADALGQHGHIQKWTMYDCVTRVPLLCRVPRSMAEGAPAASITDELVQLHDLAPTILETAGVPVPPNFEARSLLPRLTGAACGAAPPRDVVYAELGRDHIQSSAEHIIMRRDRDRKLVLYPGTGEGELYDLHADAGETRNLWHDADLREWRDRTVAGTLEWAVLGAYRAHRKPTPKPQDRKSTRLNSSHSQQSRMPSSA